MAIASPWTVVNAISACSGDTQWRMGSGVSGFPTAQSGSFFFQTGCVGSTTGLTYELRQDIDVSSSAIPIDASAYSVVFSGYMQSFAQTPADQTQMIIEYRNAANTTVLGSYNTGVQSVQSVWTRYSDTRNAPVGTRIIRVRLLGTSNNGNAVDSYFDNLSLVGTSTLPVTMAYFNATPQRNAVRLDWKTTLELNNKGFSIERSPDGLNWKLIDFVPAANGTDNGATYVYNDGNPLAGTNYYRLKQQDIDGRSTYYEVKKVEVAVNGRSAIFPNPARNVLNLNTTMTNPQIKVVNMQGTVVLTRTGYQKQIAIDQLPAGVYYLILKDGQNTERLKFMKY